MTARTIIINRGKHDVEVFKSLQHLENIKQSIKIIMMKLFHLFSEARKKVKC